MNEAIETLLHEGATGTRRRPSSRRRERAADIYDIPFEEFWAARARASA